MPKRPSPESTPALFTDPWELRLIPALRAKIVLIRLF